MEGVAGCAASRAAVPAAAAGAVVAAAVAAGAGVACKLGLISSMVINFSSHSAPGAPGATPISFVTVEKHSISTCTFHTPSSRSGKV